MSKKDDFMKSIAACEDAIIQDTINLMNIPSTTGDKKNCEKALFYLLDKASVEGMKVAWTPERDCGVIEIGQGGETLGVLTHVDVVEAGDLEKWETPPFQGHFDGQWIVGRGAMDDKGPTVVMFHLLKLLQDTQAPLQKKIQLIIGTQEEGEWTDMVHYKEHFQPPDFGFTPDGAFPVHNIENGYADVVVRFMVGTNIPGGEILEVVSGDSANTIPSKATFSVRMTSVEAAKRVCEQLSDHDKWTKASRNQDTIKVLVEGKSSHSSLPENGDSALTRMMQMLWQLHQAENLLSEAWEKAVEFIMLLARDFHGNALGFENRQQEYNGEWIGSNIVVPTILMLEDGHLLVNINIRHKVGVTRQELNTLFTRLADQYSFDFQIENYSDPLHVSKEEGFFQVMHQAYEEMTGKKSIFALATGTSYAKALPRMVSWGPVFPGEPDSCHQENEKITLDSLMTGAHIYGNFLYTIATSKESFVSEDYHR